MSFLKKLGKLAVKGAGKAIRAKIAVVTGGASEAALRGIKVAKALAATRAKKAAQPKSVRAAIAKLDAMPRLTVKQTPTAPPAAPPGMAPRRSPAPPRRNGVKIPKAPKVKAAKAPKAKGTRRPPSGGLDLKALAAQWRAAGKPGKWIDFVKANR